MIFLKKHATQNGVILAMCDEELIGKVLKSGKVCVDLERYASFYKGELVSEDEAAETINGEEICSANIVGKRSAGIMIRNGIVSKKELRVVGRVPIVQIYKTDF